MNNQFAPPLPHSRPASPAPQYALRKDLGFWELTFAGHHAIFKHEHGAYYVAYLLLHPPQHPMHAVDLEARIPELSGDQTGLAQLTDPATGEARVLESHGHLQERSLALDDTRALREFARKEKELERILDDENEAEPVKAEALQELEALGRLKEHYARRSRDNAQRVVERVRKAIRRFCHNLCEATDPQGNPHPVLRPFGQHLEKYLLRTSAYRLPSGAATAVPGQGGCLGYEPPPGVVWRAA